MAVDMFLKLDGVNGESKDKTHKLDIDVLAWSWGMSNSGSAHQGRGSRQRQSERAGPERHQVHRQ